MAKKKGKDEPKPEEEYTAPLPLEAEEGAVQLKWGQYVALAFGVVFLGITLYMIFEILPVLQQTPGLPYPEIPIAATAFFAIGAAADLAVAVTARPGAIALWHQGKFAESEKFLLGWRAVLSVVAGGVIPGFFLFRASDRLQPLVEMQHGGLPPPGMQPPASSSPPPSSMMSPSAPMSAGYSSPPPMSSGGGDDSVAPNPFGSSRVSPPPPPTGGYMSSNPPPRSGGSPWSRPATSSPYSRPSSGSSTTSGDGSNQGGSS